MKTLVFGTVVMTLALGAAVAARQGGAPPAGGRAGGAGGPGGRAGAPGAPAGQTPAAVPQIPRSPAVDQAAHDRGRAIWARECIDCHGSTARGSDTGPNIIRARTTNFDRTSFTPGSVLGPFLKTGHPTQSGKASAAFTDDEVVGLAHFIRQKVNDTMRGSPLFTVGDILVGSRAAGQAYFNGAGQCASCHNASTRNLAGIGTRVPVPVDLQQRMLFPGGGGGRGRGAAPVAGPNATTVSITTGSGPALAGVLVEQTDFFVTLRLADGSMRTVRKTPGSKVVLANPLQAHIDLLEVITDAQIHDVVAYLESLK